MNEKATCVSILAILILTCCASPAKSRETIIEFSRGKPFPRDGSLATIGYEPTDMEKPFYDRLSDDQRWTIWSRPEERYGSKMEFRLRGHRAQFVSWWGIVRKIEQPAGHPNGTLLVENKYGSDLTDEHIQTISINGGGDCAILFIATTTALTSARDCAGRPSNRGRRRCAVAAPRASPTGCSRPGHDLRRSEIVRVHRSRRHRARS